MTDGSRTGASGTPMPVDVARDRPARIIWVPFLGGPVTWVTHFMVVYLAVEAGCSGDGRGLDAFDPPVPARLTLGVTVIAALGCLAFAAWSYRRWRADIEGFAPDDPDYLSGHVHERDRGGVMDFAGILLSLFSFVAVLFVGLPALVFEC
jgi:hypothetical protein